jgi:hypothetical protein
MTCCPFCKRLLFAVAAVGVLACAEHGLVFSNQDGPEPEGARQAIVARPVPAITTTSGSVPGFVRTFPHPYHERPSWNFVQRGSLVVVVTPQATAA